MVMVVAAVVLYLRLILCCSSRTWQQNENCCLEASDALDAE